MSRFFLDHQQSRSGGRERPHLSLVADVEAVEEGRGGRVVGGSAIDGSTMSAYLCDCTLHRVLTKGRSAVLDYGTATRTIPANLWNALVIRDEHCRFPGCDRPSPWCEGHHVRWVTHGGATEIETSSSSAPATTTNSTNPSGRPSSCPTPPSRSPTPTAW